MKFSEVTGLDSIKQELVNMVNINRVPHAILFTEDDSYGALPLAISFIQYFSCIDKKGGDSCGLCANCSKISKLIHPDLHFAYPVPAGSTSDSLIANWRDMVLTNPYMSDQDFAEKSGRDKKLGLISVNEASLIFKKLSMTSFEGFNKYMVIWLAEKMSTEASNKLLKLIEEPPKETYIILISRAWEKLLPTIKSRCRIIHLPYIQKRLLPHTAQDAKSLEEDDRYVSLLIDSSLTKNFDQLFMFWEDLSQLPRDRQIRFCKSLAGALRSVYMLSLGLEEISFAGEIKKSTYKRWADNIKPSFFNSSFTMVDDAIIDIERSVNSKYIFSDLAYSFFLTL